MSSSGVSGSREVSSTPASFFRTVSFRILSNISEYVGTSEVFLSLLAQLIPLILFSQATIFYLLFLESIYHMFVNKNDGVFYV
jgi:hypothetical protein